MLAQYAHLLHTSRTELGDKRRRLLDGIAKLSETNSTLDAMRLQLNELQPLLAEKTAATSTLLRQVCLFRGGNGWGMRMWRSEAWGSIGCALIPHTLLLLLLLLTCRRARSPAAVSADCSPTHNRSVTSRLRRSLLRQLWRLRRRRWRQRQRSARLSKMTLRQSWWVLSHKLLLCLSVTSAATLT